MAKPEKAYLKFKEKQVIFRQGEPADCMYDIQWGRVGIYADYGTPGETMITELKAGEFFGEMGLVETLPRSATAVALEKNTLLERITEETFCDYFQENPRRVLKIMQNLSGRLRGLTKDYMEACQTVTRMVETEKSGAEKSSWLDPSLQRFIDMSRGVS